jgi:uroporphyrin-III C-methyltransferase
MRLSPMIPAAVQVDAGLVFVIGSDPDRPGELSWPALAALAAADAVVHDGGVDPDTLALIPHRCFVEAVPGNEALPGNIARVRKLAGEGWRVVWLVVGDPANSPDKRADAERLAAAGITIRTIASLSGGGSDGVDRIGCNTLAPQSFATALNGLAG